MGVRIPNVVRQGLRERLWARADELDWHRLNWFEKSAHYTAWTGSADVGGLLANYMDTRQVRVYIKDTVMKGYVRSRQAGAAAPLRALGLRPDAAVVESWERPHGRLLADGKVIAWGNAEDWKLVVTAIHERAWGSAGSHPFGAVLLAASGRYAEPSVREMVQDAASRLRIQQLAWID